MTLQRYVFCIFSYLLCNRYVFSVLYSIFNKTVEKQRENGKMYDKIVFDKIDFDFLDVIYILLITYILSFYRHDTVFKIF